MEREWAGSPGWGQAGGRDGEGAPVGERAVGCAGRTEWDGVCGGVEAGPQMAGSAGGTGRAPGWWRGLSSPGLARGGGLEVGEPSARAAESVLPALISSRAGEASEGGLSARVGNAHFLPRGRSESWDCGVHGVCEPERREMGRRTDASPAFVRWGLRARAGATWAWRHATALTSLSRRVTRGVCEPGLGWRGLTDG
ncbi:hypothetical protein Pen01_23890 [Phytomonospora endophytica]|nr:hypothetical protein Pen01_23890 [Phytomonospora endophytica]